MPLGPAKPNDFVGLDAVLGSGPGAAPESDILHAREKTREPGGGDRDDVRSSHDDVDLLGAIGAIGATTTDRLVFPGDNPAPDPAPASETFGASEREAHEIEVFEVRHLAELPVHFTMILATCFGEVAFTTSRADADRLRRAGLPHWTPAQFELAAYAIQTDRAGRAQWDAWCAALGRSSWRLSEDEAMGLAWGLRSAFQAARRGGDVAEPTITVGALLRKVGAHILRVEWPADEEVAA